MKKIILTTTLLFSILGFSQTIDWMKQSNSFGPTGGVKDGQDNLIKAVEQGKFTYFEIKNINKFYYKVEIAGQNFDLQTPIPTELQTLFRLTPEQLSSTVETKTADTAIESTTKKKEEMQALADDAATPVSLKAKLTNVIKECDNYIALLVNIKTLETELKLKRNSLISASQAKIGYPQMQVRIGLAPTDPSSLLTSLKSAYTTVESEYKKALTEAQKVVTAVDQKRALALSKATRKNKKAVELLTNKEVNEATDDQNKIAEALSGIEEAFETLKSDTLINLYDSVNYLYNELNNEANFTVEASPIQMNGDFVEYKCKISPSQTRQNGPYENVKEFKFIIPGKGGAKVDFSVGPTVSFGNNAKDEKYYLEESTTAGKSYLRQRDNNNSGTPGLAAMMHVYRRNGKETAFGGMFGVGAGFQTIDDVDLSFYLGGTLVIGKTQKVMLNAGLSFLRVDRLKDGEFKTGNEYTTQDFDINNVVEKVFKSSFFISLSYSLSKRVDN